MGSGEITIVHHVGFVLLALWISASFGWCHPFAFFISLLYLYKVNQRLSERLRRRLQFEEKRSANARRIPLGSESVRWLNCVVEKVWPVCMEQIASQKFLLPIIPWFLDNYKPWTAKKASVQDLYLGRSPPIFTEIRVLDEPDGDDDLVLELGMNFLSAEDMIAVLVVQLRKRLGFGMRAKMNVTGMHVEGKLLVGVKFIRHWPYVGRVRVCFAEPPYFQMTVKPIFHHGVDVTELPGIAGWLDKILDIAFEETLVEPNMLVVDMEKFASETTECWFTMDEKHPIAFVKLEIIEAVDMKAGDISGVADPYVKGQLGPYRFTTKVQKKTLAPKWQEEFKIPISTWESPNELSIQVCDKDRIFSDMLGECWININDFRGGQRHDKWFTLQNIRRGRLHLAITVLGENEKGSSSGKSKNDERLIEMEEDDDSATDLSVRKDKETSIELEPNGISRDRKRGSKGCDLRSEAKLHSEDSECINSPGSEASTHSEGSNKDAEEDSGHHGRKILRKSLQKIGNKLHINSKNEHDSMHGEEIHETSKDDESNLGKGHIGEKAKNFVKHLRDKVSRRHHDNTEEDDQVLEMSTGSSHGISTIQ